MENTKVVTVESVCKSFTEDQLNLLATVFSQDDSEISKLVKAYVLYKVTFTEENEQ